MANPRIYTGIPYCHKGEGHPPGKDLGRAYNEFMALIPDDAWAVILDHDAMFCSPTWFRRVEEAIEDYPDAGLFAFITNRLNPNRSMWQMAPEAGMHNHLISAHRGVAAAREAEHGSTAVDVTHVHSFDRNAELSGVGFAVSKQAWIKIGGALEGKFTNVDHDLHHRIINVGLKVYLLPGVYMYHWFRYDTRPEGV